MSDESPESSGTLVPSQRRLQRAPDFTGSRLASFTPVALRHGLPGLLLGLACVLHPELRAVLANGLDAFAAEPLRYLVIAGAIFLGLLIHAWSLDRRLDLRHVGWVVYLLGVSTWEEWVFRLALPALLTLAGFDLWMAVVASSLVFGGAHYFTLRWKWPWCLGAFVAGLALSRQYGLHGDLALIVGLHWVATYFNTPRLPGSPRSQIQ